MMRSNPKIKRVQLIINQNNESVLVGIVSAEPDYKLSLTLNKKLNISLKSVSPVLLPDESGRELVFSRFSDTTASQGLSYDLTSNRCGKNFLIKKLKNIDYILHIHSPENEAGIERIISILRETESVTAVFNIDPNLLKDKNLHYLIQ
jgi:hypothetical protein